MMCLVATSLVNGYGAELKTSRPIASIAKQDSVLAADDCSRNISSSSPETQEVKGLGILQ